MKIMECVPNFSEGRDESKISAIVEAIRNVSEVKLLNVQTDKDHNRSVITFIGNPESVQKAAFEGASRAIRLIDMRSHKGSHPRMGAVDVIPFVPIVGMEMSEAVELSRNFGKKLGELHNIPVYFYEESAAEDKRRNLADIRKGEYEGLPDKLKDPAWKPDAGSTEFNAASGATVVGARFPLIAFNVNLNTPDVEIAQKIAKAIRHIGGGLRYVKAMGVKLSDKNLAQVSMNLVNYQKTPIHRAVELIRAEAARYGVTIKECELVGLMPMCALEEVVSYYLQIPDFSAKSIIEYHLLPE